MKTLNQCILNSKKKYNTNIFLKTPKENIQYNEFFSEVVSWADYLVQLGLKEKERVGIIVPKSPLQMKAFYSIWLAGAVALPINENSKDGELKFILEDATPSIIITTSNLKENIKALYKDAKIIVIEEIKEKIKGNLEYTEKDIKSDDVAALIYTSGSTGNPKGVMLTHENLLSNGSSLVKDKNLTEKDCLYSLLPYWHSFSLSVEVVAAMVCGCSVGFTDSQRNFLKYIPQFNPSIVLVVPRVLELIKHNIEKQIKALGPEANGAYEKLLEIAPLVKKDRYSEAPNLEVKPIYDMLDQKLLSKLRATLGTNFREFISGGAALNIDLQRYFGYLGIHVMQGYGLSEVSPVVSVDNSERYSYGSVGELLSWLTDDENGDYTFLDKDGNMGKELKGELLLKGKCVMKGYWNHKDESAKAIKGGWLFTGDIGYCIENKLYLDGRKKNMIVLKGGENVHPEPIEEELKKSEVIDDVMIIGDGYKNLYACLTVPEHYDEMNKAELKTLLKSEVKRLTTSLISYQKPRDIIVLNRFNVEDKTYTGTLKIRRHSIIKRDGEKIESFLKKVGEK